MASQLTQRDKLDLAAQRSILKRLQRRRPKLEERTNARVAAATAQLTALDSDIAATEVRIAELEAKDAGAAPAAPTPTTTDDVV